MSNAAVLQGRGKTGDETDGERERPMFDRIEEGIARGVKRLDRGRNREFALDRQVGRIGRQIGMEE